MSVQLRYKNSYIVYNDFVKKYINMTAFNYQEDLTSSPFKIKSQNYKKFRLCSNKDYQRISQNDYIDQILEMTDSFAEHCIDNFDDLELVMQNTDYLYKFLIVQVTECDPNNSDGIVCESDQ